MAPSCDTGPRLVYWLDADDVLSAVGESWEAEAAAHGAPELTRDTVLGRPLSDFIRDAATTHLYRVLYSKVRAGGTVTVPVRCIHDGIEAGHVLRLTPAAQGGIRCAVWSAGAPVGFGPEDPASRHVDAAWVPMCSWCNRIQVHDEWLEADEALLLRELFLEPGPPAISHGICPSCLDQF